MLLLKYLPLDLSRLSFSINAPVMAKRIETVER
jgi:hypothetical protein